MRLPETGKRKYGLEVLKMRNQLYHVHSLAFLVGVGWMTNCSEIGPDRYRYIPYTGEMM